MKEVSVLVGGKAGDGINNAGAMVGQLLNHLGYYVYMYTDYPSLIRGGHNFAIVRGGEEQVRVHHNKIDFLIALDQKTVDAHQNACPECMICYNSDLVRTVQDGQGISVKSILAAENAPPIMGNSAMIGAFAKTAGVPWDIVDGVFHSHVPKGTDMNLKVARQAFDQVKTIRVIEQFNRPALPLISGNEAIGLGLTKGGMSAYISYPMTPSSALLHFLADNADRLGLTVVHPENEIAVILTALGFAYAGRRAAVGTSGGGFCLMTEGLSFAGMAELPLALLVSQRTGPSTGLPTYTGQSELWFVLNAGQGEFPRLVVAPADANEAFQWSAIAMNAAWKFQVPAFILADKTLSEGLYSLIPEKTPEVKLEEPVLWDKSTPYQRYKNTPSGVTPLAFPGTQDVVVKVDSYAHDESGITTEDGDLVTMMAEKRLRKGKGLAADLRSYQMVNTFGNPGASTAILCWGSVRGVCAEVGSAAGLRVVQPVVLSPFPAPELANACAGVNRLIAVEENATGQLAALVKLYGITVHDTILKFDGRPFTPRELDDRLKAVLAK